MHTACVDYPSFNCPKCNRSLKCSGVLTVHLNDEDREVPVYQCDECIVMINFAGEQMEGALTFAVGADGQAFDPSADDGRLRF